MTTEMAAGPQLYRLRGYDGNAEIMTDRCHLTTLDLDTADGRQAARVELESTRIALAHLTGADGTGLEQVRLAVHEYPSGAYVTGWVDR